MSTFTAFGALPFLSAEFVRAVIYLLCSHGNLVINLFLYAGT
jgi:hypothetical protein